jgi:hypothetical protein
MKKMHHIANDWGDEEIEVMAKHGIVLGYGTKAIQIEENETYFKLKPYFDKWKVVNMPYALFTKEEQCEAELLAFLGNWDNGYPEPERDQKYFEETYDLSNYCKKCGSGATQKAPFRIKSEPKWGKHKIFQLTWVGDEIFSEKAFYSTFFEPLGIGSRPVLIHKTGEESQTAVQLELPVIAENLNLEGWKFEICTECERKKYTPKITNFVPMYSSKIPAPIFKGQEYFGSGRGAFKRVVVTQNVMQGLIDVKTAAPVQFVPLR